MPPINTTITISNSNNPDGPFLTYTVTDWRAFLDRVKEGEFDDLGEVLRETSNLQQSSATPRAITRPNGPPDQFVPVNLMQSVDRQIERAMETDNSMRRYRRLLRLVGSMILMVTIVLVAGCIALVRGVGAAHAIAGLPPQAAWGVGAGGTATVLLTVAFQVGRHIRGRRQRRLQISKRPDNAERKSPPNCDCRQQNCNHDE